MGIFSRKDSNGTPDEGGALPDDAPVGDELPGPADDSLTDVARTHAAIAEFWQWWIAGGKAEAAEIFSGGGDQERLSALGEALGSRVKAIGDLAVATGPGRSARHCLVVTAGGTPDLRDLAAAWLAAAPPADADFEYADHRQPHPDPASLRLRFDGGEIELASTSVVAVAEGPLVHVQVAHPMFEQLNENDRAQVTFLFLDAVLGERIVEDRIGEVAMVTAHDDGVTPVSLVELPAIVEAAG